MRAFLVQCELQKALRNLSTLHSTTTLLEKADLQERVHSRIILYLVDNVLREIDACNLEYEASKKLEDVYLTKSLTNWILLIEWFFGFKIDPSKNLEQNLDEFKKIEIILAFVDDEKIGDESQAIIMLNSLLNSYREVKATIKFGRKIITLDGWLQLKHLVIGYNQFSNELPSELTLLSNLKYLDIPNNTYISRLIPLELSNLMKLEAMLLFTNHLLGKIHKVLVTSKPWKCLIYHLINYQHSSRVM